MANDSLGGSYLAALKRGTLSAHSAAVSPAPIGNSTDADMKERQPSDSEVGSPSPAQEKRRGPRYKCNASAEVCPQSTQTRTWATCTDISVQGCYLEASATHPIGTVLQIKIEANDIRIISQGNVRANYPHLGMGIAFTYMSEENRAKLKEMLRTLGSPSVIMGSLSSPSPAEPVPHVPNPQQAVSALTSFFRDRPMMTRADFIRVLRESQSFVSGTQK
ncbi:MAG TPA: PilZ domain-containing protein [Candidatus Sulfotelmatobacter sp.]